MKKAGAHAQDTRGTVEGIRRAIDKGIIDIRVK